MHGTLGVHSKKFFGVLNGIDQEVWDPATDTLIDCQYSAHDIDGKFVNKQRLRERLGLASEGEDERRPLVGLASLYRLVILNSNLLLLRLLGNVPKYRD